MASNSCKLLCLILFLAFVTKGYGDCHLNDLTVKQSKTGKLVQNKPEWEVTVTIANHCKCYFHFVDLSCAGFQSVTPVATSLLSKSGDLCLINGGRFLYPESEFFFTYVWDTSFNFKVKDGEIVCP